MKNNEKLKKWLYENNFPHFYGVKIMNALFKNSLYSYDEMTQLPEDLRKKLNMSLPLFSITTTSKKQTESTLMINCKNSNGEKIVIRSEYRKNTLRGYIQTHTENGTELTPEEISDQVLILNKIWQKNCDQIELFSKQDPLTNSMNLKEALNMLTDSIAFAMNPNDIVIHTTGFVPGMRKIIHANDHWQLNIGLHNVDESWRQKHIHWGKAYSLNELMQVIDDYQRHTRKKIVINYCLISGENDSDDHARQLINALKGKLIAVNLFSPQNPIHKKYHGVPISKIHHFKKILEINKIPLMPDLVYKKGDMYEQSVLKYHFK